MDYETIKDIDIFSTELFSKDNIVVKELFSKYNIKSLKDFLELIDKYFVDNPFVINDKVPFWYSLKDCEMKGISDLLKNVYLGKDLHINNILKSIWRKCDFTKTSSITIIKKIRILGFTEEECSLFIDFANKLDNNVSIGDILCLLEQNKDCYDKYFVNKISILCNYYRKIMGQSSNIESLKQLYSKLERQLLDKKKLEENIANTYNQIDIMLRKLSSNEYSDEIIKLSKKIVNTDNN